MSLISSASITLGSLVYDSHTARIDVTLGLLPAVNVFRAVLPAGVEISAAAGDDASLELDGGEGAEMVLTGKVRMFRRRILQTEVAVADGGADLARLRARATFEKQNARDVIKTLASEAGAEVGTIDPDLPLAAYAAHQGRTAAEHVASLAKLAGAIAHFNADGELQVVAMPSEPDVALLHGREIIDYDVIEQAAPEARRIVIGNGPAGSADAPHALRPTLEILPGDAPESGSGAIWVPALMLRTPGAATTASQAADVEVAANATRIRARCFLLPKLRPGNVVEVQELPNDLHSGPWMLTRVTHRLAAQTGGTTTFEGVTAGAGGLGGLLGAALSAVGSLL